MRLLLDTHVLLHWLADSSRLYATSLELLRRGDVELLWSAASTWEISVKVALGKLRVPGSVHEFVEEAMRRARLTPLRIEHAHAARVAALPRLHQDPFDRMLVAQAQVERLPLLSLDPDLTRYDVEIVR